MKTIQMLLLSICVALGLCSCGSTQTATYGDSGYYGPAAYQGGGDHGRRQKDWQPDPKRPIGSLDTHHHSGMESQAQNIHFRVGVDTPRENQPAVLAINRQLGEWFRDFHGANGRPPTNAEVVEKATEFINAEPLFAGKTYTTEEGKQGCWGVSFDHQVIGEKRKTENPTTTTTTDILDQAGIPASAKRLPAVRGPERFQPPVGHRKASNSTPTTPTQTTSRSSTPSASNGPPVIGTPEPELPQ